MIKEFTLNIGVDTDKEEISYVRESGEYIIYYEDNKEYLLPIEIDDYINSYILGIA